VRFIAWQTRAPLIALLPIGLLPGLGNSSAAYGVAAAALTGWLFCSGTQFVRRQSAAAARHLLVTSIVYLPAFLLLVLIFTTYRPLRVYGRGLRLRRQQYEEGKPSTPIACAKYWHAGTQPSHPGGVARA